MEQTRSMLAVNIAAKLPAHLAIRVLVTAIGAGVVTDQLLRATPWGVNLTLSVGAVVLAAVALAVGLSRGGPGPPTLQERVQAVAADLRCPVCQNLSVADSPSELAQQMRAEIAARLRAGQAPDAIRQFFVSRYGRWISGRQRRRK